MWCTMGDRLETANGRGAEAAGVGMPRSVRLVLWSLLAVLVAGALALIALRGNALMLDISSFVARFCGL